MKQAKYISLALLVLVLTACYRNESVTEYQVGIQLNRNVVQKTLPPGVHSCGEYWCEFAVVDVSSKVWEWTDADLVTNDGQLIGVTIGYTIQRNRDSEAVLTMWRNSSVEALDDAALQRMVENRLARIAKDATTNFSFNEMVGIGSDAQGRGALDKMIEESLSRELAEVGVLLVDFGTKNIDPGPAYRESLEAKSQETARTAITAEKTKQLREQLAQEKAQTEIAIEQAQRDQKVAELAAQVYETSPFALELEKARIMAGALKATDKVYFVPNDSGFNPFMFTMLASQPFSKTVQ